MPISDPGSCDNEDTIARVALSIAERLPEKSRIVFKTIGGASDQGIASEIQHRLCEAGFDVIRVISKHYLANQESELSFDFSDFGIEVIYQPISTCTDESNLR